MYGWNCSSINWHLIHGWICPSTIWYLYLKMDLSINRLILRIWILPVCVWIICSSTNWYLNISAHQSINTTDLNTTHMDQSVQQPNDIWTYWRICSSINWRRSVPKLVQGAEVLMYPTAIGSEPQDPTLNSFPHWQRTMQGHSAANLVRITPYPHWDPDQHTTTQILIPEPLLHTVWEHTGQIGSAPLLTTPKANVVRIFLWAVTGLATCGECVPIY
jgi:hypothetical protein